MNNSVSTVIQFGNLPIQVSADSVFELMQKVSHLNELRQAYLQEGLTDQQVEPFFARRADFEFFGFRTTDGSNAEVTFGKAKGEFKDPDMAWFAYGRGYQNEKNPSARYKGFTVRTAGNGVPS